MPERKYFLPVIVFAQFAGTSLWFAGNAVLGDMQPDASAASVALITSLVQFGFISGTLVFAIFNIADRFRAGSVFFFSSLLAALANAAIVFENFQHYTGLLRFVTGFFLAGIYPVGMKIAADWFAKNLGNALGYLVGALVLGTAFPHLLKGGFFQLPWKAVLIFTSALAVSGGLLLYLTIPSRPASLVNRFQPTAFLILFRSKNLRAASFGYFGHMWELYTFWAFLPLIIQLYNPSINHSLWAFLLIASGAVGCVLGGELSKKKGSRAVALSALLLSAICCLLLPLMAALPAAVFLIFLLLWGMAVVADSPQFSSLVAASAPQQYKGTALTLVTSLGFAITIISMQMMAPVFSAFGFKGSWLLALGPAAGVWALLRFRSS